MANTNGRDPVPAFSNDLFPYRQFPAWISLMRVLEAIGESQRQREPETSELVRLDKPLIQAGRCIAAIANGGLTSRRWQRRATAALVFLERAAHSVPAYEAEGALTRLEGDRILDGIIDTCDLLKQAIDGARIVEEDRASRAVH
jgi:hypothetical protein